MKRPTRRNWIRWYQSGAVKQPVIKPMKIDAIVSFYHEGQFGQNIHLGQRITDSGPGWSTSEPVLIFTVPLDRKYQLGQTLFKLPGNAVPHSLYFPD